MTRLMISAGIDPKITAVRPGEAELSLITGAKAPSGVPVVIPAPSAEPPRRAAATRASASARNRTGRTARGRSAGQRRAA